MFFFLGFFPQGGRCYRICILWCALGVGFSCMFFKNNVMVRWPFVVAMSSGVGAFIFLVGFWRVTLGACGLSHDPSIFFKYLEI